MTLRRFFLGIAAVFLVFVVVMAIALLNVSSSLKFTAQQIVDDAESIRASEELEVHLLNYARDSRLYELTDAWVYKKSMIKEETALAQWLSLSHQLAASPEEANLVHELRASIQTYLSSRKKTPVARLPAHKDSIFASEEFDRVYLETEKLTKLNLAQAQNLEVEAAGRREQIVTLSFTLAGLSFILMVYLFFLMRRWVFRPAQLLLHAVQNFSTTPAPEDGPFEISQVGKAVNKLNAEIREQKETRVKFLASVAHDLRNPLGAIRMSAELLAAEEAPYEEQKPIIEIIARQATHLERLVGDLLEATRIEGGHLDLQRKSTNIVRLVEDAVILHRSLSTVHQLEFESVKPQILSNCDGPRLSQVLNNLLSNAIKYSPDGGNIAVRINVDAGNAVISVSDQGIGIALDDQSKIFEPFHRTRLTKSTIPGVGLGLSIAKKIVEAHGGKIWIESCIGKGTKFFVRIPLQQDVPSLQTLPSKLESNSPSAEL